MGEAHRVAGQAVEVGRRQLPGAQRVDTEQDDAPGKPVPFVARRRLRRDRSREGTRRSRPPVAREPESEQHRTAEERGGHGDAYPESPPLPEARTA